MVKRFINLIDADLYEKRTSEEADGRKFLWH